MDAVDNQSRWSQLRAAWNRFWFTPADPTVLGAIRILTGLITFYTLFAYSFDLHDLAGKNAWLDLPLRQEQYREAPVVRVPLGWTDSNFRRPNTPEEQAYFERYVQRWGSPPPLPYPRTTAEEDRYDAHRARWGVDPRQVLSKGRPYWSVWFHIIDPFWMSVAQGGIVLCSFLFLIGLGTRFTSVLTWIGAMSFIHRAPASLFGVDTMMTVLLLYLMIGPSGAALSVDQWIARWWAKRRGLPAPAPNPSVSANLALRLIQVHACIIYMAAGLAKLQGQSWWTGVAPWGTIANFEFAPMQYPIYVDLLRALAQTRWIFEVTMTVGALGTLAFEIGYPFAMWRPTLRPIWLGMAVLMHLGIGMLMGLRTFALIMLAFNVAFISPETVRWALGKLFRHAGLSAQPPLIDKPERPSPGEITRPNKSAKIVATTHVKRKH